MPAPRERIWGRIWHDQPDTQARKSLNTELWRLADRLRDALETAEDLVRAEPFDE